MTILEAMKARHSVRRYISKQIQNEINNCNIKGGLNIQLITDEPKAFSGFLYHYGKFNNVQNYIALIGNKSMDLDEKIGYYGERLVLLAQMLGLNTCWVAATFNKKSTKQICKIQKGEKLVCVIALGYGATQGISHKSKDIKQVCKNETEMPNWYKKGIEFASLAPTAINQQKFEFSRKDNIVSLKSTGGFYSKVDLGIVKYHFEMGAGIENFSWE